MIGEDLKDETTLGWRVSGVPSEPDREILERHVAGLLAQIGRRPRGAGGRPGDSLGATLKAFLRATRR